jgi:HSP20 family protein
MKWHNQPTLANFFDDLFDRRYEYNHKRNCGCSPLANVVENDDAFELKLSVPGYDKKDIAINLENNVLTISSEKEIKEEKENTNYTMREFSHNSFSRSFTLPKSVNADKIKAAYENGILNLTLPKKDEEKMKLNKEIKIS